MFNYFQPNKEKRRKRKSRDHQVSLEIVLVLMKTHICINISNTHLFYSWYSLLKKTHEKGIRGEVVAGYAVFLLFYLSLM